MKDGPFSRAFRQSGTLRRDRNMDKLEKDLMSKANIVAIERQREALIKITANIEEVKLQILEGKFERGDSDETVTNWSKNVEEQVENVDAEVEKLQKYSDEMKANEASKAKEAERAQQLHFEKEQYEQKLHFEHKVDEIKKDKTTKKPDFKRSFPS